MPLDWRDIKIRAAKFAEDWRDARHEAGESQTFYNEFFEVFGNRRRNVGIYEKQVTKLSGNTGHIDLFWSGTLLVEQKSAGRSLAAAREQAADYFVSLKEEEKPRWILVSDFQTFELMDLEENKTHTFPLSKLADNVRHFAFIAGYKSHTLKEQDPVNIEAAERLGKLHDQLKAVGYTGHDLEVYLVRLLFCMFAENTGIFEPHQFQNYLEDHTQVDGSDLAMHLDSLFDILNKPRAERLTIRAESLSAFPHINGKLFEEGLARAAFDRTMRDSLLQCCDLDWSRISPAIFGSLFQSIMDKDARRNLGAHYTSEKNILKLINPLFMDDLRAEFETVKRNKNRLFAFHKKLQSLEFLDPACGCGNFLVIAYRELRLLELEVLRATHKQGRQMLNIHTMVQLNVDQFFGIEIEEFPAQIAQTALWLMDHQMNMRVSEEFGMYFARIPLETSANIVHANALTMDWADVVVPERLNYIMGNPPFIGHQYQTPKQKTEMRACYKHTEKSGVMDYVTAWYCKAVEYIGGSDIKAAFVSTNSITQGGQVAPLWKELHSHGATHIHFAHRTFKWSNEARGKAAVYCVIIGFGAQEVKNKRLFEYEHVTADPHEIKARNINSYLIDAPDYFIESWRAPICPIPPMVRGSSPVDGGNLLLDEDEKNQLLKSEPNAARWIKPYSMGDEFINGIPRYCLWLADCPPNELRTMPLVLQRVDAVRQMRLASKKIPTQRLAKKPKQFGENRQSESPYLAVPRVSSERRLYIPIGFLPHDHIAGDKLYTVPNASIYVFGIVTSLMHMAWMRVMGGRLKSDYSYSTKLVYNTFSWPKNPSEKQTVAITEKAQAILDARAQFPESTLADLYDPLTMPPELQDAHDALDKAVDRAYRKAPFNTEAERVAFLFDLYQQYTAPTLTKSKRRKRKKK